MFKKKMFFGFLLIMLVVLLYACGGNDSTSSESSNDTSNTETSSDNNNTESSSDSDEVFVLKFATSAPADHPFSLAVYKPFYERIEELSEGRIEVEWYPGEQLGKGSDYLSLTGDGVADLAYISPSNTPSDFPITSILGVPGLFEGQEIQNASHALLNVLKQNILLEEYLKHNVRPVVGMWSPPAEVFFNDNIEPRLPGDMKGLKIATSSSTTTAIFNELGSAPVQLNAADMYSSLDNGVVDGTNLYASTVKGFGMSELIKSGSIGLGMGSNVLNIIMNEDTYQKLPEDLREVIMQAGEEISGVGSQRQYDDDMVSYEEFKEAGINVYELTDSEKSEWQAFYDEFIDNFIDASIKADFDQVYEAFKKELESLR